MLWKSLPQIVFVTFLSLAHALALWALIAFVSGPFVSPRLVVSDALVHALASGIAAPVVTEAVVRLLGRLGEDEGQRPLRLASRALAR